MTSNNTTNNTMYARRSLRVIDAESHVSFLLIKIVCVCKINSDVWDRDCIAIILRLGVVDNGCVDDIIRRYILVEPSSSRGRV